jgi:two-component system nitrogen regulation response regulator GlnG
VLAALADDEPQVLVSDIRMPGGSGLDLLGKVKEQLPNLPVIIMTAYSDLDSAVSAFQRGAFEYLPKPFDLTKAVELIRRAVEESLREEVSDERNLPVPEILGQAPAMQDVFRAIGRLSQSNVTVLITGESGSGKELVARALHRTARARANGPSSPSTRRPFPRTCWSPNCSATSAAPSPARRPCAAAASSRPRAARCSSTKSATCLRPADAPAARAVGRPVLPRGRPPAAQGQCAGHRRHPPEPGAAGARWRLPRRPVPPPERDPPAPAAAARAPEDVPALARFFLQKSAKELGVEPKRITDEALERLKAFSFPGNVRQLENVCHWLTVMAPAQVIESKDLPPEILSQSPAGNCRPRWRHRR